jgi:hypothetical protein
VLQLGGLPPQKRGGREGGQHCWPPFRNYPLLSHRTSVNRTDRCRLLFGPYRQPRCRLGNKLFCEMRGWVKLTRVSDGRIPWPMTTKQGGKPSLVLCGDLVGAVKHESNQAVAYWWGVTAQTVTLWRKALDVPRANEGTHRLHRETALGPEVAAARMKAQAKAGDPGRRSKIASTLRGRPRPRHVMEATWAASRGKRLSPETRRRMSEAHEQRGTRPPKAGRPWTDEEDRLIRTLTAHEVSQRTGRSLKAVYLRRRALALPDGRCRRST